MHPLIGLSPLEELPPAAPPDAPEPPEPLLAGRKWCTDCDHPHPEHAPDCPSLRRPTPPEPAPYRVPTWKGALVKALHTIAKRLEDSGSKEP